MFNNLLHNRNRLEAIELLQSIRWKLIMYDPQVPQSVKDQYQAMVAIEEDLRQAK